MVIAVCATFSILGDDCECVLWCCALHVVSLHCDHSGISIHTEKLAWAFWYLPCQSVKNPHIIRFGVIVISRLDCENFSS